MRATSWAIGAAITGQLNDAVGARSVMARLGWLPRVGGMIEATYRSVDNEDYGAVDYQRGRELRGPLQQALETIPARGRNRRWRRRVRRLVFADQCLRSVLDGCTSMKTATPFFRVAAVAFGTCFALNPAHAEVFVDIGINGVSRRGGHRRSTRHDNEQLERRACGDRNQACTRGGGDIGARLEIDDVDSDLLFAVRALDYRFHPSERLAVGAFFGAARLDLATPAYGYYLGGGVHFKELLKVGSRARAALRRQDRARQRAAFRPARRRRPDDNFYDLSGVSLYLSRRF